LGVLAKYGDAAGDMAAGHMTARAQTAITAAGAVARQILWNTRSILIGAHIANIGKVKDRTFGSGVSPLICCAAGGGHVSLD
jgi:chorismate synthase